MEPKLILAVYLIYQMPNLFDIFPLFKKSKKPTGLEYVIEAEEIPFFFFFTVIVVEIGYLKTLLAVLFVVWSLVVLPLNPFIVLSFHGALSSPLLLGFFFQFLSTSR